MTGIAQPRGLQRPADTSWHERAACTKADPELFYHPDGETGSTKAQRVAEAKEVCGDCPILATCRAKTLHEEYGVWGGLSEDERAAIRAGDSIPSKRLHLEPFHFTDTPTPRTLDPEIVLGRLNELVDAGFNPSSIGKFAGVHPETVRTLLKGTKAEVYRTTAEKLLSVQVREQVPA